ncbi:MAG: GAF domain-containing protein [Actinobacteria bacterium]|nr:GAF domain-containing protein [Actinomycetota bacterium]
MERMDGSWEGLRREARMAGLTRRRPSLEALRRRRRELRVLAVVLLAATTATLAILELSPWVSELVPPTVVRIGSVLLALGFAAYVVEKEVHLRRLRGFLEEERAVNLALSTRVRELNHLVAVSRAINSARKMQDVLETILSSAVDLLEASGGAVMLLDPGAELRIEAVVGDVGDDPAGPDALGAREAVSRRETVLSGMASGGTRRSFLFAPLENREQVLGVLAIASRSERPFTEYERRVLSLFADQTAVWVANARLHEVLTRSVLGGGAVS